MHELIYFDSPGYAEPTRFCLEISELPWKNTTVDWDGYQALKENGELPWGYLPVLKTPQGTIAESNALMRYAAAVAGLEPEDLFVRGKVDEILELIQGWRTDFTPTFRIQDLDERIAARQALFVEGTKLDLGLKDLESLFNDSTTGWLADTEDMTLADVKAFLNIFMMFSGQFDGIDTSMVQAYPSLLKYHHKVANDPRVKAYYDREDEYRWVFKPGAFDLE
ncbi:MAG: glutathione S-transferase family protein [Candidatus Poseidoniaceae archaeon]|nr:glutathione S-transferase family protein [Candidatus Poseidoniaceae archaeon]